MFRQIWLHKTFIALGLIIFAVCVADFGFAAGISKDHYFGSKLKSGSINAVARVIQSPKCMVRAKDCVYPCKAKQCGKEGCITLRCIVDKNGEVQEVTVVEAEPEGVFEKCALAGVKKLKFEPAMKDGEPVDCIVNIPIRYTLAEY